MRGIEEVARKNDHLVLAGSTDGLREREDQLVEAFVARRVDGLIVVLSGPGAGPLKAELDRGTPVVLLDLEVEGLDADLVRSDHRRGALLATRHLQAHDLELHERSRMSASTTSSSPMSSDPASQSFHSIRGILADVRLNGSSQPSRGSMNHPTHQVIWTVVVERGSGEIPPYR